MPRIHPLSARAAAAGRYLDVVVNRHSRVDAVRTVDAWTAGKPERVSMYMLSARRSPAERPAVAVVDTNTSHAIPHLLEALRDAEGATPDDVKWIIVTHVHLDHCAGAGTLLQHCPNATVLCHPRARKHLVEPEGLLRSARTVYRTPEAFAAQVGNMVPCPEERVRAVADGEVFELLDAGRPLKCHFMEGHARHHIVVHDPVTSSAFTGDAFGSTYDDAFEYGLALGTTVPATTPIDFDFHKAMEAADRVEAMGVAHAWPTHFGPISDVPGAAAQLRALLPKFEGVRQDLSVRMQRGATPVEAQALGEERVEAIIRDHFAARGLQSPPADFWTGRMRLEREINTQGLVVAAQRFPVDLAAATEARSKL